MAFEVKCGKPVWESNGNKSLLAHVPRISCSRLVALSNSMRLSLKKAAHAVLSDAA